MNFKAVNVSPMEKVFPTAAPSEEGAREKLSGLRGEIVSFQLAYYAESPGLCESRGGSGFTDQGKCKASEGSAGSL